MNKLFKIFLTVFTALTGIFLFQAQDYNGYDFRYDNDPLKDLPTREAYLHYLSQVDDGPEVITDALGFDNFDIGIDFAEQHVSSHPTLPLWIFVSANASPQNAYWTTNGGLNWTLNNPNYPGGTCCDPWSAYTGNGVLIYGSGVSGQYVYRSTNNGQNWTAPVLSVNGNDRNTLAAEVTGTGPYANYVYAAITPGNFARSTDLGATWTQTYSSSNTIPGVMIASGPNGSTDGGCVIYVTNTGSTANVTYTFHRSTNGGATFTVMSSLTVAGYVGTLNSAGRLVINHARTRPYPMIAMDNSNGPYRGRLYLVYASNDPPGNGNKPDIFLQYSTDQGATWSSRIRVNDDANPQSADQWFPAIWCETTTGKLYIKWYDTRENPSNYTTGVWATYSTTGGTSFVPNQRISNASWVYPCPACSPNTNCYRGDYDAITANPKVSFAAWYDPRNCTYLTMGSYFPDYAVRVQPSSVGANGINDSAFVWVSVPAVKLYNDTALFSATVTNPPGTGTITLTFLNRSTPATQNFLTSYPDSLRLRIKTSGGVPNGLYNIRIQSNGPNGTPVHVRTVTLNVGFVGVVKNNSIPKEYYLYQNYPNPFNPFTRIKFDLPAADDVELIIYDITGREVQTFSYGMLTAGSYTFSLNAYELPSGVYFYKIKTSAYSDVRKMILIK